MDRLGPILARVVAHQPGGAKLSSAQARQVFLEILGASLAGDVETCDLRSGVLHVETPNPSLAHLLTSESDRLLERLNLQLEPTRRVRAIKIRTGRGPR